MNWMFESRSKNLYDDDTEGGTYSLPLNMDFVKLLKKPRKRWLGIPAPGMIGILLTVILGVAHGKSGFEFSNHPLHQGS